MKRWFYRHFTEQEDVVLFLNRNGLNPKEVQISANEYYGRSKFYVFYYAAKELVEGK